MNPAAQKLLSFLERIERLEEERKTLADDIADIYSELKADGYDKDAAKIVLKIRKTKDGLDQWTGKSSTVDAYLSALGMLPPMIEARAGAPARENIEQFPPHNPETGELTDTQEQPETAHDLNNGEDHDADSEQCIGRQDGEQHHAAPVQGAVGRGESADDGDQGQGAGASGTDRGDGPVAGTVDREDEDGRSRHVGGEARHKITPSPELPHAIADDEATPPANVVGAHSNPLPTCDGAVKAPEAGSSPASGAAFDNPRCKSPDGCTFAHSRNSCWECTMAWAKRPRDEQVRLWQEANAEAVA